MRIIKPFLKNQPPIAAGLIAFFFLFLAGSVFGQENGKNDVRVKVVKIVDGDTTTVEKVMNESNVEDFAKQYQNAAGKNVQVMITVKNVGEGMDNNPMHFNFDLSDRADSDNILSNALVKKFMFSDSIMNKDFEWRDSLLAQMPEKFDFNFDFGDDETKKDLGFNIDSDNNKTIIIKDKNGKKIIVNGDDENFADNSPEEDKGKTTTRTKTIVIKDENDKSKKKIIVSTSVTVLDLDDNNPSEESKKLNKKEDSFNFYPNPSDGSFILDINKNGKYNTEVRVTDINGKEIYKEKISSSDNSDGESNEKVSKIIDLGKDNKGTFIVTIKQGNKITSKKIIIE